MLAIRRASVADAEGIARVHVASWRVAYRGVLPRHFLDALSWQQRLPMWISRVDEPPEHEGFTLVAVDDDIVVGFAVFGRARDEDRASPEAWELYAIYLDPGAWGQGVGRALVNRGCALLPRQVRTMSLWVLELNARARAFYEAVGFVPEGVQKVDVLAGLSVTQLRYVLEVAREDSVAAPL